MFEYYCTRKCIQEHLCDTFFKTKNESKITITFAFHCSLLHSTTTEGHTSSYYVKNLIFLVWQPANSIQE